MPRHLSDALVCHVLTGRQGSSPHRGRIAHVQGSEIWELASLRVSVGSKLRGWSRHPPPRHGFPGGGHVMRDFCFLQLVVVRRDHGMHAVGPVALQERLSSHECSVVFTIRALMVYAVLVGLLVLPGLVLVVVGSMGSFPAAEGP